MEKFIYFNNHRFCLDERSLYYRCSQEPFAKYPKYLHRYVWELANGKIPNGMDVHHKNHDRTNNSLSNLELLKRSEHKKHHFDFLPPEEKLKIKKEFITKTQEKAKAWHKSQEGKDWHREQYQKNKTKLHSKIEMNCNNCKKIHLATKKGQQVSFCSNACKSAYRRKTGADNITKTCEKCGTKFVSNKYKKTIFCSKSCAKKKRSN